MNSNDLMIGVAGEHLVCSDLISKGFTAFMTEQGLPYDVIAEVDGSLKKIQVKTTRTHKRTPQRTQHYPAYLFHVSRCGKRGKKEYGQSDVDIFAIVCLETKQVGYLKREDMPTTLSVRVDKYKGSYLNEVQESRAKAVFDFKKKGMTNVEIGRKIGMNKSVVGKVLKGESKKTDHGVYFSDLTVEKVI